ncbi:helix-turn-helix transcriptional regulator [Nocardioides caldifontis]|uniref:helix-turn-helix transcriptional regulator n=1 Tax=Nocardioides caldifontis TaxID=2588938 RepID=UPI001EF1065E|nr:helix-turn-helix transcriptional regulator [Nocardioides caldifontis]
MLRRLTLPALAAVVEDDPALDAEGAWQLLQGLPFTRRVPGGLVLEPVARAVVADAVELRDPRAVRATRGRVARRLVQEPGPLDWGTTADLLHLVQNPVIRHAYEPAAGVQHPVERATPADSDELLGIVAEHQGPAARRVVEQWWAAAPWAFAVARGESAQVRALSITAMLDEVPSELASGDPVVVACHAYARRRPPAAGTRTLLFRTALGRERGEQPGVELATMVVELKRHYFEHRHELGRVLTDVGTWDEQADALRTMGFEPVGPVRLGGRSSTLAVLEFGSGGVEGWLARHVLAESGAGRPRGAGPAAARDAPPAPPPGPVARLSPRELEVLLQLAEGRTNRELADALFISERTANRHVSNIFQKLGVRNRTAAARAAVAAGLVR